MSVELRHLRYFVAVAEESSFTAAARRLHVAQQVLSRQVRQLEATVGVALLERTTRGVTLTPSGAAFLDGARETLARLDRAELAARNIARAANGTLTVGLGASIPGLVSSALLGAFECACPQVTVRLRSFDLAHPAAGLLDHGSDVAFVRPPVSAPGIELLTVASKAAVFVLPDSHPLAGRAHIDLGDAIGFPWVAVAPAADGCEPGAWRDHWLCAPRPGQAGPLVGAVARTMDECWQHVMSGHGIALCWGADETTVPAPGVAVVPGRGTPDVVLSVAWRADDRNPLVRRFVEVVKSATPALACQAAHPQAGSANRALAAARPPADASGR